MMQKTEDFPDGNARHDLPRLRALCEEKPDATMALVRAAWPQILTALRSGHTLKRICQELNKDGLTVGYKTLSAYVGRLRRERTRNVDLRETRPSPRSVFRPRNSPPVVSDPLAHAMEACAKPRYDITAAHCDGDPSGKKLI